MAETTNHIATIGRRKSASARVRLTANGSGKVLVNGLDYTKYFATEEQRQIAVSPLAAVGKSENTDASVKVLGGGKKGQSVAVRLGIARALIVLDETLRKSLKSLGYLSRDARVKERKKFGHRKARRSPQWSKR